MLFFPPPMFGKGANVLGTYDMSADAYASSVVALWPFDEANGATSFTDRSGKGHTLTATGSPVESSTQAKFGTTSLSVPGGTWSYLTSDSNTDFSLDGDFTIECWAFATSQTSSIMGIISRSGDDVSNGGVQLYRANDGTVDLTVWDATPRGVTGPAFSTGAWHHVAIDRAGTTCRLYFDGAVIGSVVSSGTEFGGQIEIGRANNNSADNQSWNGYLQDIRITKGVARYAGLSFVPPTDWSWRTPPTPSFTVSQNGLAVVGSTASIAFSPSATSATYQWKKDGVAISGATSSTYVYQAGDSGHVISCSGTATNSLGTVSYTSTAATVAASAVRGSRISYVNNANSISFSLPSGSLAGDDCFIFAGHGYNVVTPSGWTNLDTSSGSFFNGAVFHKVLTAADITAATISIGFGGAYYGVVAGFTFAGRPTAVRTIVVQRNGSGSGTRTVTTGSSPVSGDIALYFGSGRANTAVTSSVGTQLQTTTNSEGSGVLASRTLSASGADSSTFTFAAAGSGDYEAIVVVQP